MLALAAPAASAKTYRSQGGGVTAVLVTRGQTDLGAPTSARLTITRADSPNREWSYDDIADCDSGTCLSPQQFRGHPAVQVVDLDGGEPEIVLSLFSGGAHCCTIMRVLRYQGGSGEYTRTSRNFGNPSFTVRNVDHRGPAEIVSANDAYAYRFTAYAWSGLPITVDRFAAGRFRDVSRRFPRLLRADAASQWRSFRASLREEQPTRGFFAAWASDMCRAGRCRQALAELRRRVRNGDLGVGATREDGSTARFAKKLTEILAAGG